MKKILFICDGNHFPQGAFCFLKQLRDFEAIFVKGLFFTHIDYVQLMAASYVPGAGPYVEVLEDEHRQVNQSKTRFVQQCKYYGINYHLTDSKEEWNRELFVKESRFSDMVVISEELFCANGYDSQPNSYMREALAGAECPVMVIPENFTSIDRIVVAYDGKKESMIALRQLVYLLPAFADLPVEFVYVKDDDSPDIPDYSLLKEYISLHFSCLASFKLHFNAGKYFKNWLNEKTNVLLVTGAYSRSAVSNLINHSFADPFIQDHSNPLFVSHQL